MNRFHYLTKPLLLLSSILISLYVQAQSYDDYSKEQEEAIEAMKSSEEAYIKKQESLLAAYAKERDSIIEAMDKEFSAYLKDKWAKYESTTEKKQEEKPKPDDIPAFNPKDQTGQPGKIAIKEVKETEAPSTVALPTIKKTEPEDFPKSESSFNYYNQSISIEYDKAIGSIEITVLTEQSISSAYEQLSQTNYNHCISALENEAQKYNLNDWGFYSLTKQFCTTVFSDKRQSQFLHWFILSKAGYKVKLAYNQSELFILAATKQTVFGAKYLQIDGTKYYALNQDLPETVQSYEKNLPIARKTIDLNLYSPVNFGSAPKDTTLQFEFENESHEIKIAYNPNVIAYYSDYPKADITVYYDAGANTYTKESIRNALQPIIANRPEQEAVSILLGFVQKAFAYKTDQDQFGFEKYFFPDELFFYQYSDCEDRSILFAYLIRELMELEVVGLEYSGHMATAVHFNDSVSGDYFMHNNKRFTVCDPTYVNAPIGKSMPQFENETPQLISLSKGKRTNTINSVTDSIFKLGGIITDLENAVDTDAEGNIYITGHFKDTLAFDQEKNLFVSMKTKKGVSTNDIFINKYKPNGELEWARKISGKNNDMAHSLKVAEDGSILFAGSYNAPIKIGKRVFTPTNPTIGDMFVARCTKNGSLLWVQQLKIEALDSINGLFSAKLKHNGDLEWLNVHEQEESFNSYGLSEDSTGVYLVGGWGSTPGIGIQTSNYNDYIEYSEEEDLYEKSQALISDDYDPTVAGLFAAVMLIENTGSTLPGRSVQKTINVHNPAFKKSSADIYDNLGKIKFMKNAEGIVTVKTTDSNPVMFSTVKVEDNSHMKISIYSSGNAKIDILSGVSVGKSILWYNLNYIKLQKNSGDLIFDYDTDHTQKVINLRQDILQN